MSWAYGLVTSTGALTLTLSVAASVQPEVVLGELQRTGFSSST